MCSTHTMPIYFTVRGDFASADFIRATGLFPDEINERGSPIPGGRQRADTACDFIIRTEEATHPIPCYAEWLQRMQPASESLAAYIKAHKLDACLVFFPRLIADSEDSLPAISLDKEVVQLLAKLDAAVDVDLYLYDTPSSP